MYLPQMPPFFWYLNWEFSTFLIICSLGDMQDNSPQEIPYLAILISGLYHI